MPTRLVAVVRSIYTGQTLPIGWPISLQVQVIDDCANPARSATVVASFSSGDPPLRLVSLQNGTYAGTWQPARAGETTILIRALEAGLAQAIVTTHVQTPAYPPARLSQTDFVFIATENSSATQRQDLQLINLSQSSTQWTLGIDTVASPWLSAEPTSGSTGSSTLDSSRISIVVNPSGLRAGAYQGVIRVSSSSAGGAGVVSGVLSAAVHLLVVPAPTPPLPNVLPGGLVFVATQGGADPAAQSIAVRNLTAGNLSFSAAASTRDGSGWLSSSPIAGTTPATISVQTNIAGLAAGAYTGTVAITFPGSAALEVGVLLVVKPTSAEPNADQGGTVAADCVPSELRLVSRILPNNFTSPLNWPIPLAASVADNCGNQVTDALVVATFSSGNPLALNSLYNGSYSATWVPLTLDSPKITVTAQKSPMQRASLTLTGTVLPQNASLPAINPDGLVHGASFLRSEHNAPGSILAAFGSNFSTQTLSATSSLPTSLGGFSVKIGDLAAPLYYVSPTQANIQLPVELPEETLLPVVVTAGGRVSPVSSIQTSKAGPGIFFYQQDSVIRGAILDANYRLVNPSNPVKAGDTIQLFATGLGATNPAAKSATPAPSSPLSLVVTTVEATIGGQPAQVAFAGLAPGFVGLYQVNVVVPAGLPPGDQTLALVQGRIGEFQGFRSNEVKVAVK